MYTRVLRGLEVPKEYKKSTRILNASQRFPNSQRFSEVLKGSHDSQNGSQGFSEATIPSPHEFSHLLRGSLRLPRNSESSTRLLRGSQSFSRATEVPKGSQELPGASSQT